METIWNALQDETIRTRGERESNYASDTGTKIQVMKRDIEVEVFRQKTSIPDRTTLTDPEGLSQHPVQYQSCVSLAISSKL
jgi:hypothetical protein